MNRLLVVSYVLISVGVSLAQLSGPLSGTLGPGEYHVIDTISVDSTDILTLMPGTTFNFDGAYPFNIYGTLLAEGTETDSIIFTTDTTANPDRWRGLRFSDSSSSGSRVSYCLIQYSLSGAGGGVYCFCSSPSFEHCTISDNHASTYGIFGGGGGVACVYSSATFTHCIIRNNTTSGEWYGAGGGVYCWFCSLVYRECSIVDNRADLGGGLMGEYSSGTFIDCIFAGNSAGQGGGISGTGIFENCIIAYNSAGQDGGAYCGYWNFEGGSAAFMNCVMVGNAAGAKGGGVYCSRGSLVFNSTIIAFSEGDGIYFNNAAESQITYCNIFGNNGGNIRFENGDPYQGPPDIGQLDTTNANRDSCDIYFNIFLDPMFVDTAANDYHLLASSPCIDAGDPTLPFDPDSTIADIGAFYFDQLDVDEPIAVLPMTYALHPNWPNPFNPITNIRYDMPQAGHVRLIIYNLLGQEVTRLVDKQHLPGSYTVSWNATNWPSGLYFCRMTAAGFVQTRKLMLIK